MHKYIKSVRRQILPVLLVSLVSFKLQAQEQEQDSLTTSSVQDSAAFKTPANDNRLKVKGIVKDASTGKPLDGISISVAGYSASITNDKGEFKISVPNYKAIIVLSGQGFKTKEIVLNGKKEVSAILYEDTFTSGYDVVKLPASNKLYNHVSGAIKSINISDNWQKSAESADTYLQGRIAGLNAIRRSGTPAIGANLFLRGYTSLYATNQPLIVVDGIIYDDNSYGSSLIAGHVDNPIANIDLKDVDNITIVKDATASSFGTKAANGIIYITTARAKEQATKIDFAAYGGFNSRVSNIPLLGKNDYRSYLSKNLTDYLLANGYSAGATQSIINAQPYMDDVNDPETNPTYYQYHENTNWQDKVLRNSFNQNYYLKVTGGDNIATYGLSVGFMNNSGITRNTDLTRYQTRFNADLNLSKKLKGNANLSFISNEQNLKDQGYAPKTNPLYLSLIKAPFLHVNEVAADGGVSPNFAGVDIFNTSNPAAVIDDMQGINKNYRFLGSVGFNYEFTKQLNLNVLSGVTFDKVRENIFVPKKGVVPDTLGQAIAYNKSGSNVKRLYSLFVDTRLSYNKSFNHIHNISTNVGLRYQDNKMESDYGFGYNSATDDYVSVGMGQAALRQVSGQNGDWRWMNLYGSADYELMSKYMLSLNVGVDGSSRFGKNAAGAFKFNDNNYAVMPSVSAGWLISSEKFLSDVKFIDLLKLRASYGTVGNDDIGNYSAKQYYLSQNFLGVQGLVRGNIANTSLKWESIEKLNIGLDASFLNERLNIAFDVYKNRTHDMIIREAVPSTTGFDYVLTNSGGMETKGIDLSVFGRVLNSSLKWDMGLNISKYKSTITKIPGDVLFTSYAGATVMTRKGMASNLFYGYKTSGVYSSDAEAAASGLSNKRSDGSIVPFRGGDVRFVNTYDSEAALKGTESKIIDENDMQVIGDPNPDFTGMFSNMFSYKRFSLDAMFSFSVGNDIYNFTRRSLESMSGTANQTPLILNRWKADGDITNVPRAEIGDPAGNSRFSDRWIEDGSYLRLRSASFTYDVPLKASSFKYAKVYITGSNLFTISKYLGYDPEFSAGSSLFRQGIDAGFEPQFRSVQLGVRVGL